MSRQKRAKKCQALFECLLGGGGGSEKCHVLFEWRQNPCCFQHYRGDEVCEEFFEKGVKKKDGGRCWPNNEAKEENIKNCFDYHFEH